MITRRKKTNLDGGINEIITLNQNKTSTKKSPAPVDSTRTTRSTATKFNGKKTEISTPHMRKRRNNVNPTVESVKKKLVFSDTSQKPDDVRQLKSFKGFTNVMVSLPKIDIVKAIDKSVAKKVTPSKTAKQKKVIVSPKKSIKIVLKKSVEDAKISSLTHKGGISDNILKKSSSAIIKNLRSNNRSEKLIKSPQLPVVADQIIKFNEIHKKVANKKVCQINIRRLSKEEILGAISGNTKPIKKRAPRKNKIDPDEEKKVADAIKEGIAKLASSTPTTEIKQHHTPIYKNKVEKAVESKTPPNAVPSTEVVTENSPPAATNNQIFDYFSNSQEISDDEDNVEKNKMKLVIEKLCREKKIIIKHKTGRKPTTGSKIKSKLAGIPKPKSVVQGNRKNKIVERQLKTLKENLQSSLIQQKIRDQNKPIAQTSQGDLFSSSGECQEIPTVVTIQQHQEELTVQTLSLIKHSNGFPTHSEISMLSPIAAPKSCSTKPQPKPLSLLDKYKIMNLLNMPISQSTPIRENSTLIQTEMGNKEQHEKQPSAQQAGNQSPWRVETEDIRKVRNAAAPIINKPSTVTSPAVVSSSEKLSPINQLPLTTAHLDSTVRSAAPAIQIPTRLTYSHNEETPQILSDTTIGRSNIENCDPEDTPLILVSPVKSMMERPVGRSPLKDLSIGVGYNGGNTLTSGMKSKSNYYPKSPLVRTYQNPKMNSPNKTFDVPQPVELSKSVSKSKLPDLFGFESDIEDESSPDSNETKSHVRSQKQKLIKQTNQKFKETCRNDLFVAPASGKTIKKNPQTKKLFKDSMSNNELQSKKIPEIISEQVCKLNNMQPTNKANNTTNIEEQVQLFQPLWPEIDGKKRKSYTRIPKRKYKESESEESDLESNLSSPHKNKKKRVALSRKQLEKEKVDKELDKFAAEFNSMCEEIDTYKLPVEVIGNSSGGSG